jgi:hypothetical protein
MRSRFPTQLGLISALGVGSGCNDPCDDVGFDPPPEPDPSEGDPPEVIAGEWIGPGVLELRFSRPLGASGQLDTNRFAILSWSAGTGSYYSEECDPTTNYRALTVGYYSQSGLSDVWIGPEDDRLLRLRVTNSGAQCQSFGTVLGSGVMLAYTNVADESAGPGLLDENGNPVPDIGPAWAIMRLDSCFDDYYCGYVGNFTYGHLPQLDTLVQIPCP